MTREEFIQKFRAYVEETPQHIPYEYTDRMCARDPKTGRKTLDLESIAQGLGTRVEPREVGSGSLKMTLAITPDALVSDTWRTGGMSGGSCWHNEGATIPVDAASSPAFFPELGEVIHPEMPYRLALRLFERCKEFHCHQSEYYGNYTTYAFRVLKLDDMLDVLFPEE